ncbi:hypothetical protein NMG60_11028041 [Bertholletia excelsa]
MYYFSSYVTRLYSLAKWELLRHFLFYVMELELGLSLPTHRPVRGFDLNQNGFEAESKEMSTCPDGKICERKKLCFAEAFESGEAPAEKLLLLSWNGQPNEEDDGRGEKRREHNTDHENGLAGEENKVVGWPPIKSWRKRVLHMHSHHHQQQQGGLINSSAYVKVKMEGVAIGRKIDLRLYHSYHTLTTALLSMFSKNQMREINSEHYTLAYQDKEGDWKLAGDVPWQ